MEKHDQSDPSPVPFDVYLGAVLRRAREDCAQTQENVAEALDLTYQMIGRYEHAITPLRVGQFRQFARVVNILPMLALAKAEEAYYRANGRSNDIETAEALVAIIELFASLQTPAQRKNAVQAIAKVVGPMAQCSE
ncbi:MAG: helix-turn-helix transcriptional regulator [Pseudomonadota bacterium]